MDASGPTYMRTCHDHGEHHLVLAHLSLAIEESLLHFEMKEDRSLTDDDPEILWVQIWCPSYRALAQLGGVR